MGKKILVVEDDKLSLAALDNFLSYENFLTRAVAHAEEVEIAVEEFKPDLIVMDIRLDTADGRTICDKLKSGAGTSHIPIVLLTGLSYDEIARLDCQADAIIGKPFESGSLLYTINQCLKTG
ncbi:response regulator [Pedobacter psychrodurus]|uniref:response regulator n=1 Tax=Pedobacter psychrodurus TaxID=2530456 RepID=UPI002930090E|nr:response regulator [Pedobacter psychrodurus]